MARTFTSNKILKGTNGRLWVNAEPMADVKSFEAKSSADFEEISVNGDFGKKHVFTAYSISGTMTLHKIDSYIFNLYADAYQRGEMPDVYIIASITDPQTSQTQRIRLTGVQFSEITLLQFENGTVLEEEVPFTAEGVKPLDGITR